MLSLIIKELEANEISTLKSLWCILKCIVMITKEGSTQIVNFMTPGAGILVLWCGHLSHIVKMHYFF